MDKLQKTAAWLWLYKERIIFVIMVLVLGQRVWLVMNPVEVTTPERPLPPMLTEIPPEGPKPPPAPRTPVSYVPGSYPELTKNNVFWLHAGTSTASASATEAEVTLELLRVSGGSTPRAQIRGGSSRRGTFYSVGDTVEGFTVESIDVDAETVTVVNESTGERRTLELSQ